MQRPFPRLTLLIFLFLAVGLACGCAWLRTPDLRTQIRQADKSFQKQQYGLAAILYNRALDRGAPASERQRMMFQVGCCFYNSQIRALDGAQTAFEAYLEAYPNGSKAEEARRNLERIEAVIYNREKAARSCEEAAASVEELRKLCEQEPYDADLRLRLGNALWELRRYDEACQAYLKSTEINAWLRDHEVIKARLTTDETGEIVPNTPERQRRLEREKNPLVFFDLNDFRSRRSDDFLNVGEAFYTVTGMVRNQSSRSLRGVTVEVRFLNPARKILDVQQYRIGAMPPGDMRGFSVRAMNFDNIYNISSYECVAYED